MPYMILVGAETESWNYSQSEEPDYEDMGGAVVNVWATPNTTGFSAGSESLIVSLEDVGIGDYIYAVVADYLSGDTFGRNTIHSQVLDAFATQEEAEDLIEAEQLNREATAEWTNYSFTFNHNGKEYRRYWEGYFETLNSLDVWKVKVAKSVPDPMRDIYEYEMASKVA